MIFNFTDNYQFSTRLTLENETLEVVKEAKLLGVIVSNDLKWQKNTEYIVKKAYRQMEILRIAASFGAPLEDKKLIYISYIRSVLEQSCHIWNSRLTEENIMDLERVQKSAVRIILNKPYENYYEALDQIDLESLADRREHLCLKLAKKMYIKRKDRKYFSTN